MSDLQKDVFAISPAIRYVAVARLHARMPETIIRRLLALVVVAIGIRYLVGGLTGGA